MATLFNTKISATYEGLLKTIDNAVITATLRELTDGSGNQSGLFLNTAGDFKVTSVLEWGSLKDTGTGVTITQFVTAANGIENFNNDTTLPTSAAVKLYVDTKFSQTDTLTEVLGFGNTTSGKDIAVSAGDDITFTDNSKILMGDSNDLQIYHSGATSLIEDLGTGDLNITSNGSGINLQKGQTAYLARFYTDGANELYYSGSKKIETVTGGAKVTGNLEVTGTITGVGGSFLPLAGGTMTGNTLRGNNVKSIYGTGNALEIYGETDGFITSLIDDLVIRSADDIFFEVKGGENAIIAKGDEGVELYFNNSKKIETTNTGITITGGWVTNGVSVATANVEHTDNTKSTFGNGNDFEIYHDSTNNIIKSNSGQFNIDQGAVTQSIVFKTSDTNALDTTALIINRSGDLITGRDVTIAGDLTVNGTTTTVNSQTLSVKDPLISLAINNSANSLDIGYYGKYNDGTTRYQGLFNDASDSNKFKLFKGLTVEPTTTVNIGGTGYVAADLVVAGLEATSAAFSGDLDLKSNSALLLDNSNNNNQFYIRNSGSNSATLQIGTGTVGGNVKLTMNGAGDATFTGDVTTGGKVFVNRSGTNGTAGSPFYDNILQSGLNLTNNSTIQSGNSFGSDGGTFLRFQVNSASAANTPINALTLDSSGNGIFTEKIGIGTSSPAEKLHVNGEVRVDGNDGVATKKIRSSYFSDNQNLLLESGASADIILTSSKVGIGITNPLRKLELKNITGGRNFGIGFNDKDSIQQGTIAIDHNTNDLITATTANMRFFSGSTIGGIAALPTNERMCILSNGNVGIGTSSPSAKLDVTSVVNEQALNIQGAYAEGTGALARIKTTANGNALLVESATTSDSREIFEVKNQNGSVFSVQGNGNVGIGTSTPLAKMHVKDGSVLSSALGNTSALIEGFNQSILQIASHSTGYSQIAFGDQDDGFDGGFIYSNASRFLSIEIANAERMRILTNGNVGIGTTTPTATLHVDGSSGSTAIFRGATQSTINLQAGSTNNFLVGAAAGGFSFRPNGTTALTLDASQNATFAGGIKLPDNSPLSWSTSNTRIFGQSDYMQFQVASADKVRLTSAGDVLIQTAGKGLVLKSPNGTEYKITVANDGTITSTAV